ncbi:MAG: aromatic amino acid DMT transporter YddG [Verrucomicrobiae bacterium]|nr:aromatic amino acid DMT transporter YddG [Verrucomicrobiae bacterium]
MNSPGSSQAALVATLGGFAAILLWSTSIALVRSTTEAFGVLGAAAAAYTVAGGLSLARLAASRTRRARVRRLPKNYLIGCGSAMAAYVLTSYLAFGSARSRQQTLEVALVHYLWPALTVLFSVIFLRVSARRWLFPATLLCLAGVELGMRPTDGVGAARLLENLAEHPAAYALALLAAIAWALYSTLTRRWASAEGDGGIDVFLVGTGALVATAFLLSGATMPTPSLRAAVEAALLGAFTWISYTLWDQAMRRGNLILVVIASYFTPLLAIGFAGLYLRVAPPPILWLGCALLVAGSFLSWWSVRPSADSPEAPERLRKSSPRCTGG